MLSAVMLNVVMLNVVTMSVIAIILLSWDCYSSHKVYSWQKFHYMVTIYLG